MLGIRAEAWQEARAIIDEARKMLNRWGARYAGSDHAKKHRDENNQLIERIDQWRKNH